MLINEVCKECNLNLHFAPYLNEPVMTDEQQEAFDIIVSFLDKIDFDIPADLKKYLDEAMLNLDANLIENISVSVNAAVHDMERYIADNDDKIESYIAFKQSEEYMATPAYRLEKVLREFNDKSGYNDIFVPAMCQLSKTYQKYHDELMKADEIFLRKYPELK